MHNPEDAPVDGCECYECQGARLDAKRDKTKRYLTAACACCWRLVQQTFEENQRIWIGGPYFCEKCSPHFTIYQQAVGRSPARWACLCKSKKWTDVLKPSTQTSSGEASSNSASNKSAENRCMCLRCQQQRLDATCDLTASWSRAQCQCCMRTLHLNGNLIHMMFSFLFCSDCKQVPAGSSYIKQGSSCEDGCPRKSGKGLGSRKCTKPDHHNDCFCSYWE